MFSHHPFTVHGRYSLDVEHALPTWKRTLDLGCCLVGFPLLGFIAFFTAVATAMTSGGPVIFRQEKFGTSGRRIGLYRFRTMRVLFSPVAVEIDENARSGTSVETSRMIPGGALLRATGLADLPQLVNVWRGEMSIVGPRPDAFSVSAASAGIAHKCRATLPGITGPWRFSGQHNQSEAGAQQWEQSYAETQTLGGDLSVIARSLSAMVCLRIRS